MEKKLTKVKFASVTTMVMHGLTDIHLKVEKYRGIYQPFELFPENIEVKFFDQALVEGSFVHNGIEHLYTKKRIQSSLIPSFRQLRALKKYDPDYILLHGLHFPHIILLMRFFLKKETKIIVQDHANRLPRRWKQQLIKLADRFVTRYVFTSVELARPWLEERIIADKSKIIECPEGSNDFKRDHSIGKDPNAFLWVARLDENKDPLTILRAFRNYVEQNPLAKLSMFFANSTLLKEIEVFISEHQLENNVILHGQATQEELLPWYQKSSFFLMGSSKEGGSFALMEAMACGCIPIVSDIPANRKMLENGSVGHLFEPRNEQNLTEVLCALDPSQIKTRSAAVIALFNRELSTEAIAKKLSSVVLNNEAHFR